MAKSDADTTIKQRVDQLFNDLSFDEKAAQLVGYNQAAWSNDDLERDFPKGSGQVSLLVGEEMQNIEDVARVQREIQEKIIALSPHHIPALFHVETLTGVKLPGATSFPTGIAQAATFDPAAAKKMGEAIGQETASVGATLAFSPVLDISRDARFGRQGETFGEDPTLASEMGAAVVTGIQKSGRTAAVAKHFLGYQAAESGIHAAVANIPERLLHEVYAKPFQAAISLGKLKGVMPCYSAINGEPVTGSRHLLTDLLRQQMGFKGIVASDYSGISEIFTRYHLGEQLADAAHRALLAGVDQELPSMNAYKPEVLKQYEGQKDFDDAFAAAVKRVLTLKFELGIFDHPFADAPTEAARSFKQPAAIAASRRVATESLVLLKNKGILPLSKNKQSIALIGWHADAIRTMFGGYTYMSTIEKHFGVKNTMAGVEDVKTDQAPAGPKKHYSGSNVDVENPDVEAFARSQQPQMMSLRQQIEADVPSATVNYAYGFPYVGDDESHFAKALDAIRQSDVAIITVGGKYGTGSSASQGEGIDATDINLPKCQEDFIKAAAHLNKPLIIVHFGGRPISSDAADTYAEAILEAWNPAECGSEAISSVIFGDSEPTGRMPATTAYTAGQLPLYYNHPNGSSYHQATGGAFDGYVDCPHEPRYFFGEGLAYTTFDYGEFKATTDSAGTIHVSCAVTNTGHRKGTEIVQLYGRNCHASMVRPNIELLGFVRVQLKAQETKKVAFTVQPSQLAYLNDDMKWVIDQGDYQFSIGHSAGAIKLSGAATIRKTRYFEERDRVLFAQAAVTALTAK
ncbi:glycoside hydrolase family 3 N-terminal domain-containing protein [Lacticaseibacillus camelliae]|nr:glycoside hydrolase family 3 N-terminal domain-containing protein [Lacticaseibacillus camelliae]